MSVLAGILAASAAFMKETDDHLYEVKIRGAAFSSLCYEVNGKLRELRMQHHVDTRGMGDPIRPSITIDGLVVRPY